MLHLKVRFAEIFLIFNIEWGGEREGPLSLYLQVRKGEVSQQFWPGLSEKPAFKKNSSFAAEHS